MELREKVIGKLQHIYDPELPVDIYNLGLIYRIDFEECSNGVYCNILLTFTSPNCPVADFLIRSINQSVLGLDEVYKVNVTVTFDPPWTPDMISPEGKEIMAMDNLDF